MSLSERTVERGWQSRVVAIVNLQFSKKLEVVMGRKENKLR